MQRSGLQLWGSNPIVIRYDSTRLGLLSHHWVVGDALDSQVGAPDAASLQPGWLREESERRLLSLCRRLVVDAASDAWSHHGAAARAPDSGISTTPDGTSWDQVGKLVSMAVNITTLCSASSVAQNTYIAQGQHLHPWLCSSTLFLSKTQYCTFML